MSSRFSWLPILLIILGPMAGCGHTVAENSPSTLASRAADQALGMVGKPYHYGGNTPKGFDCSGLVQYSYGRVGVTLPHGTKKLHRRSRAISRKQLERGDLLFFTQEGKKSSHVALYIGDGRFVHSPSNGKYVYVSGFDDPYWKNHFTEARRIEMD